MHFSSSFCMSDMDILLEVNVCAQWEEWMKKVEKQKGRSSLNIKDIFQFNSLARSLFLLKTENAVRENSTFHLNRTAQTMVW